VFLTRFSYFSCYFLILVLLRNHYLLISSRPFSAARESDFSSHFSYLWHYKKVVRFTCAPICQAKRAWVSQSKTISAFCRRFFFCANVRWANTNHSFLNHKNPQTDTFLHDISPTKLHSTAWEWNPQQIFN
jgi:hypothetical protein